jgi:hypothetical protein
VSSVITPMHRTQASNSDDRLRASTSSEREALARSTQQATSLASSEARFQQQLATSQVNDEALTDVFVQSFIIVGCTGGQRIIIVIAATGIHISGCRLYKRHVCLIPRRWSR